MFELIYLKICQLFYNKLCYTDITYNIHYTLILHNACIIDDLMHNTRP